MTRTEVSVSTKTTSTATILGWSLTFTHEAGVNNNVTCNGNNGSGGSLNANIGSMFNPTPGAVGAVNSAINFNNTEHDSAVAKAVMDEMKLILNPVA